MSDFFTNPKYIVAANANASVTGAWVLAQTTNSISFSCFFSSTAEGILYVEGSNENEKTLASSTSFVSLIQLSLPYSVSSVVQTKYNFEVTTAMRWVRLHFVKSGSSTGTLSVQYTTKSQG